MTKLVKVRTPRSVRQLTHEAADAMHTLPGWVHQGAFLNWVLYGDTDSYVYYTIQEDPRRNVVQLSERVVRAVKAVHVLQNMRGRICDATKQIEKTDSEVGHHLDHTGPIIRPQRQNTSSRRGLSGQ